LSVGERGERGSIERGMNMDKSILAM
jgi:hypothetical protein